MNAWVKQQRQPPSEVMMALCESYNPKPERKAIGHAASIDGYRIHINPDGSAVWLEGHDVRNMPFFLGQGTGDAIEECLKRRGIVWPNHSGRAK